MATVITKVQLNLMSKVLNIFRHHSTLMALYKCCIIIIIIMFSDNVRKGIDQIAVFDIM